MINNEDSTQSNSKQSPSHPTPVDLRFVELADALRRAIRHGRVDQARRLHAKLVRLGRDISVYELAASSKGGDQ